MKTVFLGGRPISPSKIACIGRNYVEHIRELDHEVPEELVVFLKPNSAIGEELHSFHRERLSYEAELCFLCEDKKFVAVAFGLDMTKRELQKKLIDKGLPWERCKAFDGAALFSEFVPIADADGNLAVELSINGTVVQRGDVGIMIHKPTEILAELLTFLDLYDGDIVMTGTPKGVGTVNAGDEYVGSVMFGGRLLVRKTWIAR